VLIHPFDATTGPDEWLPFLRAQGFGHLIAAGRGREVPVVVPTQFVVGTEAPLEILLHLARPNPIWAALDENPVVLLSVAGDWAYVPAAWKAIGSEDPAMGVPTTYYAALQIVASATVVDDEAGKIEILRRQLAALEPASGHADPSAHIRRLPGIRGLRLAAREVVGKFKYGGNVDEPHRLAVAERLADRGGPGDAAAREHLLRRS
jgi:transcriptional regulator